MISFFHRNLFLLPILKDLNLHYKKKCEAEFRDFLLSEFSISCQFWQHQNLALQFCRNQNKGISILTETYINLDQIHHITGWVSPFFSPADSHTGLLVLLLLGLEGDTEVDNDAKRRFVSFKVTLSNDRALYIYALSFRGLHLGTVG